MVNYGLRIGSIPDLKVTDKEIIAHVKGDKILALPRIEGCVLPTGKPFQHENVNPLKEAIAELSRQMIKEKILNRRFSAHDFRHYFAWQTYQQDKDIVAVSRALGHASIAVTDAYLQGLGS